MMLFGLSVSAAPQRGLPGDPPPKRRQCEAVRENRRGPKETTVIGACKYEYLAHVDRAQAEQKDKAYQYNFRVRCPCEEKKRKTKK